MMEENRKSQRYARHLRAVIITDENGKLVKTHGRTHDISLGGVSVISDYNLVTTLPVTVYLLIEQGDAIHPAIIFEAKSKIVSNVLSGQQGGFRMGLEFTKIAGDGAKLLKKFLGPSLPKPVAPLPKAAEPAPNADGSTAKPDEPAADSVEPAANQSESAPEPSEPTPNPTDSVAAPAESAPTPAEPPADQH